MGRSKSLFLLFSFLLFFSNLIQDHSILAVSENDSFMPVHIGVILDLATMVGKKTQTTISIAIEDFYAVHTNFSTRVELNFRDSMQDALGATSAAINMLADHKVQVIIGSQSSEGANIIALMCNRTHVPLLTFSQSIPTLSLSSNPYVFRATLDDSSLANPIASFIHLHGWHDTILIHEDSYYGYEILPLFRKAFQEVNVAISDHVVIPIMASDEFIEMEVNKLEAQSTRVFIVHMKPLLASRFFVKVSKFGMMGEGCAWIATNSISSMVETLDPDVLDAMQGLVGFRPYIPSSLTKANIVSRFKTKFRQDHPQSEISTLTVYELWEYEIAWLLAMAAEKVDWASLTVQKPKFGDNKFTYFDNFRVREKGKEYLDAIGSTELDGLSGKVQFVEGQLQLSTIEVINVIGEGVRVVGFWNEESRISGSLNSTNASFKRGLKSMKTIVWPGDTLVVSKGFATRLLSEKALRIAVPGHANNRLVNFRNKTNPTGYCIDIFDAVMRNSPSNKSYEYIPVMMYHTYDELVDFVVQKDFDAVVGDVTILANRSQYVDFSFSFADPGISMLVRVRDNTDAWIFLKPLKADLWVASLLFFFFTGFVIWVIEHRINPEFRGTPSQQLGVTFYSAFSTLVFSNKEKLESNLSRVAMIVWLFVVLVITSSYIASFTSILTVKQLQANMNVNELIRRGDYVGCQSNFVRDLLLKLGFDSRKILYRDSSEYSWALNGGSAGVVAIFDEIPYIKLFLTNHCDGNYAMKGSTYESNGFGFVFPKGSPLVPEINSAILSLKDTHEIDNIRYKWFHNLSPSCQPQNASSDYLRLSFGTFAGLFTITGLVSGLMLVISLSLFIFNEKDKLKSIGSSEGTTSKKLLAWMKFYDKKDDNSYAFRKQKETRDVSSMDNTTEFEMVRSTSSHSSPRDDVHPGSFQRPENRNAETIVPMPSEATNQ